MKLLPFIDESFEKYFERFPVNLIDIGFRDGVQGKWLYYDKYLKVVAFEPDKEEYERLVLKFPEYTVFNTALYKEKGRVPLHIARDGNLCSILLPNRAALDDFPETDRYDLLKKIDLSADTLDNVLQSSRSDLLIDFIKIDTQGTELYILQGGTQTLDQTIFGMEIEVEFFPLYQGQPLFSEVDQFAREKGFLLFDLQKHFWKRKAGLGIDPHMRGQLIHGNALYLRDVRKYISILRGSGKDLFEINAALLKAISISWMFGYSDYALFIAETAANAKLLSLEEAGLIAETIRLCAQQPSVIPNFKGKARLMSLIGNFINRSLKNLLVENYHGWAMMDKPDVGNRN